MDPDWWIETSEKYMKVNWDDELPNIWKNKKLSKPPISDPSSLSQILSWRTRMKRHLGMAHSVTWLH